MACTALSFLSFSLNAQNYKFGKVSKEELQEEIHPKDSSASAAVLYRSHKTDFKYVNADGSFHLTTNIHERIKIYDKEGFDYATQAVGLYRRNSAKEKLIGVKANTFKLVDGKVVKIKLKKSDMFSEAVSDNYVVEKFTMPQVEEGSIVEFQYTVDSPFWTSIDEIPLQYDIPINKQDVEITIPEYYSYKPTTKGYLTLSPKKSYEMREVNYSTTAKYVERNETERATLTGSFEYKANATSYAMTDIPALVKEPYVNNMDNYRGAINYELEYVNFPGDGLKDFSSSWSSVVKSIYNSDNFGKQLQFQKYFRDDLNAIAGKAQGNLEKVAGIFYHVQEHMNWNGFYGVFAEKGVRKAYKERSGNSADINLMLVGMLKAAGIKANPVLISTRKNGIPVFPTREGFNYVIAMVRLNEGTVFLDATNKYTGPNLLPIRALNWYGRVVNDAGNSERVSVFPSKPSPMINTANIKLTADGLISGKYRASHLNYYAYLYRNNSGQISEEDYLTKLENEHVGLEISNYDVKNRNDFSKPIIESYDFEMDSQADIIGDKIYFNPLFHNTIRENPFKLEQRNYPIDFSFPWQEKYTLNIALPEGYKVLSKPEPVSLKLQGNMGSFMYNIQEAGNNTLRVVVDLKMNMPSIPAEGYTQVRELYKKIVEKETEKIVLTKI